MLVKDACANCENMDLCKHWQGFQNLIVELENIQGDEDVFKIDISCKHFRRGIFSSKEDYNKERGVTIKC